MFNKEKLRLRFLRDPLPCAWVGCLPRWRAFHPARETHPTQSLLPNYWMKQNT